MFSRILRLQDTGILQRNYYVVKTVSYLNLPGIFTNQSSTPAASLLSVDIAGVSFSRSVLHVKSWSDPIVDGLMMYGGRKERDPTGF